MQLYFSGQNKIKEAVKGGKLIKESHKRNSFMASLDGEGIGSKLSL